MQNMQKKMSVDSSYYEIGFYIIKLSFEYKY